MIRETSVQIGAGRVRCLEAGQGRPVVWMHAFPLTAEMWRRQLERVPSGWRFIAPDFRGFGSGATDSLGDATLDDYAKGVLAVLDRLRIERAAVAGLSMGGYVAFAMIRLAADRIDRLILADTRPQADTPEGRTGRQKMRALVLERGCGALADEMLPRLLGSTTKQARPGVVAEVRRIVESVPPAAAAAALGAMMGRPDSTDDLRRIRVPTLVVVGDEDVVTPPADGRAMAGLVDGATLEVLPQAGHLSNLETPEEFSKAVADFLR